MATATATTAYTADQMRYLGHSVNSSAMRSWALVVTDEGADLLVMFREGGTVYRYAFNTWEDARAWDALREQSEEEDAEPVSWGGALNRFLKGGALLPIAA
jgi:hypothetical protein